MTKTLLKKKSQDDPAPLKSSSLPEGPTTDQNLGKVNHGEDGEEEAVRRSVAPREVVRDDAIDIEEKAVGGIPVGICFVKCHGGAGAAAAQFLAQFQAGEDALMGLQRYVHIL